MKNLVIAAALMLFSTVATAKTDGSVQSNYNGTYTLNICTIQGQMLGKGNAYYIYDQYRSLIGSGRVSDHSQCINTTVTAYSGETITVQVEKNKGGYHVGVYALPSNTLPQPSGRIYTCLATNGLNIETLFVRANSDLGAMLKLNLLRPDLAALSCY